MSNQKTPKLQSMFGKPLGPKVAVIKGKAPNKKAGVGFDPGRFKTQHKG